MIHKVQLLFPGFTLLLNPITASHLAPFPGNKFLFSLPLQILSNFFPRFPFFLEGGQLLSVILFCTVWLADSCPLLLSCCIFTPSKSMSPSAIMTLSYGPNDTKLRYVIYDLCTLRNHCQFKLRHSFYQRRLTSKGSDATCNWALPISYAGTAQRIEGHRPVLQQNFRPQLALEWMVGWLVGWCPRVGAPNCKTLKFQTLGWYTWPQIPDMPRHLDGLASWEGLDFAIFRIINSLKDEDSGFLHRAGNLSQNTWRHMPKSTTARTRILVLNCTAERLHAAPHALELHRKWNIL